MICFVKRKKKHRLEKLDNKGNKGKKFFGYNMYIQKYDIEKGKIRIENQLQKREKQANENKMNEIRFLPFKHQRSQIILFELQARQYIIGAIKLCLQQR